MLYHVNTNSSPSNIFLNHLMRLLFATGSSALLVLISVKQIFSFRTLNLHSLILLASLFIYLFIIYLFIYLVLNCILLSLLCSVDRFTVSYPFISLFLILYPLFTLTSLIIIIMVADYIYSSMFFN